MFIQAMAGAAEVGPDDLAVENGPDLVGENNPELENMEAWGGIISTSVRYFIFFCSISLQLWFLEHRTIFN